MKEPIVTINRGRLMEEFMTGSISASVSKGSADEEMSLFRASMEDAASRLAEGLKPETISNEKIQKGDEILGTYQVTSDAIHGGMGSVWRVHHNSWDVDLAMKRPQPKFFAEGSERRKAEFVAECENWINLGLHPNIVSCYYVRDISGVPSVFSEWMDGGSLKDILQDGSLYSGTEEEVQKKILDIAIQTARGLQYSHEKGMIHQDVKPGNILLTTDGDAKIADFGLAKAGSQLRDGSTALSSGYTLAYCPKEQAEGAPAQGWMDVYAWALTVLEMYAGERFWKSGAEAFPLLFGDGQPEIRFRTEPPEKLLEAFRRDYQEAGEKTSGKWRSISEMETLLTEIYRDTVGREYPRKSAGAASYTADSLNNMALSYLDLGKTEEARALWEQAIDLEHGHPDTLYNRALFKWMSREETDLHLLDEINKVADLKKRRELHQKAAVVRHEYPDREGCEYEPPVNNEDWTYLNSVEVGKTMGLYEKGDSHNWILGRSGSNEYDLSDLYRTDSDGKEAERIAYQIPVISYPSVSVDESILVSCFSSRLTVYSLEDKTVILTKKFPKESVLCCCAGPDRTGCYLGKTDGLYEYIFETEEQKLLVPSDSGIYRIRQRCGGNLLLLCDGENRIMVMDRAENAVTAVISTSLPQGQYFDDLISRTGTFDLTDRETELYVSVKNELFRYALPGGKLISRETLADTKSTVWDSQEKYVITSQKNCCQIWDLKEQFCLRSFRCKMVQRSGFFEGQISETGSLSGFFLSAFPSRYRRFMIPAALPEPVWSLCRIRSTSEQTDQDEQFTEYIRAARDALRKEDYSSAYGSLEMARKLPNRQNAPECWELYDELYPHFKRGKLTDCIMTYAFEQEMFPGYAPALGPDGSWLFHSIWRGEDEILSTSDGRCIRKFEKDEEHLLCCGNARMASVKQGRDNRHWIVSFCILPEGTQVFSQEVSSGRRPHPESIWSDSDKEVIAVIEPAVFGVHTLLYIDPETGQALDKGQIKPDPVLKAARKNGLPRAHFMRKKLPRGITAFLYNAEEKKKAHRRLDLYSNRTYKMIGRYDFKNQGDAYSDDMKKPVLLPGGYTVAEVSRQLHLFYTSDFMGPATRPNPQVLPIPTPIGDTSMSEDCRRLFNSGRIYRLEWQLLDE